MLGIVVGEESVPPTVVWTIAQLLCSTVEVATAPCTRAGFECVAHRDGIGAFDLVSRGAMLEGLRTLDHFHS